MVAAVFMGRAGSMSTLRMSVDVNFAALRLTDEAAYTAQQALTVTGTDQTSAFGAAPLVTGTDAFTVHQKSTKNSP